MGEPAIPDTALAFGPVAPQDPERSSAFGCQLSLFQELRSFRNVSFFLTCVGTAVAIYGLGAWHDSWSLSLLILLSALEQYWSSYWRYKKWSNPLGFARLSKRRPPESYLVQMSSSGSSREGFVWVCKGMLCFESVAGFEFAISAARVALGRGSGRFAPAVITFVGEGQTLTLTVSLLNLFHGAGVEENVQLMQLLENWVATTEVEGAEVLPEALRSQSYDFVSQPQGFAFLFALVSWIIAIIPAMWWIAAAGALASASLFVIFHLRYRALRPSITTVSQYYLQRSAEAT